MKACCCAPILCTAGAITLHNKLGPPPPPQTTPPVPFRQDQMQRPTEHRVVVPLDGWHFKNHDKFMSLRVKSQAYRPIDNNVDRRIPQNRCVQLIDQPIVLQRAHITDRGWVWIAMHVIINAILAVLPFMITLLPTFAPTHIATTTSILIALTLATLISYFTRPNPVIYKTLVKNSPNNFQLLSAFIPALLSYAPNPIDSFPLVGLCCFGFAIAQLVYGLIKVKNQFKHYFREVHTVIDHMPVLTTAVAAEYPTQFDQQNFDARFETVFRRVTACVNIPDDSYLQLQEGTRRALLFYYSTGSTDPFFSEASSRSPLGDGAFW